MSSKAINVYSLPLNWQVSSTLFFMTQSSRSPRKLPAIFRYFLLSATFSLEMLIFNNHTFPLHCKIVDDGNVYVHILKHNKVSKVQVNCATTKCAVEKGE